MDDLDHTTKQMQSMEISSVDGELPKSVSPGQGSCKDDSDTEGEIEITLSESDGEGTSDPRRQGSNQTSSVGKGVNSTKDPDGLDVVYRFACSLTLLQPNYSKGKLYYWEYSMVVAS